MVIIFLCADLHASERMCFLQDWYRPGSERDDISFGSLTLKLETEDEHETALRKDLSVAELKIGW